MARGQAPARDLRTLPIENAPAEQPMGQGSLPFPSGLRTSRRKSPNAIEDADTLRDSKAQAGLEWCARIAGRVVEQSTDSGKCCRPPVAQLQPRAQRNRRTMVLPRVRIRRTG